MTRTMPAASSPGTPTPPTAPGSCAPRSPPAGQRAVIKPGPLRPRGSPAASPGTTSPSITAAGTVTCPAGITRRVTAKNAAIFGAVCRDYPLRQRCTTAKDGPTLHLHQHEGLLRAARAARHRAARGLQHAPARTSSGPSPRSPPGAARRLKLRYRGANKNNAWLKRRTGAINLRNLRPRPGLSRRRLGADQIADWAMRLRTRADFVGVLVLVRAGADHPDVRPPGSARASRCRRPARQLPSRSPRTRRCRVALRSRYRASIAASFLDAAGRAVVAVDDEFQRAAPVGLPLDGRLEHAAAK